MIFNPMVMKKGGGQVYKITDTTDLRLPESATAGEFVQSRSEVSKGALYYIFDSYDNTVPHGLTTGADQYLYFVMPASDVITSME